MAKDKSRKRYFELGDEAASFSDTVSGLTLRRGIVGEISASRVNGNKRIKTALKDGHIKELKDGVPEDAEVVSLPVLLKARKKDRSNKNILPAGKKVDLGNEGGGKEDDDDDDTEKDTSKKKLLDKPRVKKDKTKKKKIKSKA